VHAHKLGLSITLAALLGVGPSAHAESPRVASARPAASSAGASGTDVLPELTSITDALAVAEPKQRRDAAEALIAFVKSHAAFRAEIAREMQRLGDRATAPLILAAHDPSRDVARWASGELEALGKRVPGDAVQTKSNDVLSDVLEAYGSTRDADALSAVLSFVNSDRSQIREASRHATLGYGDAALAKLREAYTNLTGAPPPAAWPTAEVARELFAQNDKLRLQEVYALMDTGLAAEAKGEHAEAVAAFERVLARQPLFERKAEMVPAFVALAKQEEEADREAAGAHYRTAARLAPDGPRAGQVASALDYLEAEDLLARGIPDRSLLLRAVTADPGNAKATDALARIDAEQRQRELMLIRYEEWALGVATLVAAAVLLVGRRRRRAT
jgi:tetratricopeptide (TPR) repeat protein